MQIKFYIPAIALRFLKWSILPAFALALMLAWGGSGDSVVAQEDVGQRGASGEGEIAAHQTQPDLNILIAADAEDGCDTLASEDDLECRIEPGASFTVAVSLDSYAGLDNAWYNSLNIGVNYSPGLTLKDRSGDTEWGPANARFWPQCSSTLAGVGLQMRPGQFSHGCNATTNSIYTGKVMELDFTCPAEKSTQTISLVSGRDAPIYFVGALWGTQHNSDTSIFSSPRKTTSPLPLNHEDGPVDTLVIHCDNYYPWDVVGPSQSVELDGIVDLFNDISAVIDHYCPFISEPCAKPTPIP